METNGQGPHDLIAEALQRFREQLEACITILMSSARFVIAKQLGKPCTEHVYIDQKGMEFAKKKVKQV